MTYFAHDAVVGIIVFELVVLLIAATNAWVMRRNRNATLLGGNPAVSVLVPARNEEANIGACLRSILAQDYPNFELIVLDDDSDDATPAILERIASGDARLRVLRATPLPSGWTGKNWACHNLAKAASGELLLFVDADIVLSPGGLARLVALRAAEEADLLTGMPRQLLGSLGERLLVPVLPWAVFSFTPLILGLASPRITPARAVGQLMLFTREAYDAVGGHESVCAEVLDDIGLARRTRRCGRMLRFADLAQIASCRMYTGGRAALAGFRKNLFAVFDYRLLPYVLVWASLAFVYVEPIAVLGAHALAPSVVPLYAGVLGTAIGLALTQWAFTFAYFGLPMWPALVYPVTMLAFDVVAFRAMLDATRGASDWRGRAVRHPRVRVF